jgi:hypothetical protein
MSPTPIEAALARIWARLGPVPVPTGPAGRPPALRTETPAPDQRLVGPVPAVPGFPAAAPRAGGADPLAGLDGEFEERAAILEYEAGLPRAEAERRARAELKR